MYYTTVNLSFVPTFYSLSFNCQRLQLTTHLSQSDMRREVKTHKLLKVLERIVSPPTPHLDSEK